MSIRSWTTSALTRHFPSTPPRPARGLALEAALDERVSFQVAVRQEEGDPQEVRVEVRAPEGRRARVRRVGYVPVRHHNTPALADDTDGLGMIPGYVPDALFDEDRVLLPGGETHAFWITLAPGLDARPGSLDAEVRVIPEKTPAQAHGVRLDVADVRIQPRRDFAVTQWFYNDALLDYYRCTAFDERYWQVLPAYFRDMVEHGQDTVYTPVFTPPLDGVKRPSQLLRVHRRGSGRYSFDWRDVERYVTLAKRCGLRHFEWTHLFTQWGVKHALRIYEGQGVDEKLLWKPETGATSGTYRTFLEQFLPHLQRFLVSHRLMRHSFFHVSDEPHGDEHRENYQAARALLAELAPWMRTMDALTDITYGRKRLTDMPIPSIRTALDFVAEDIPCWCYYCCGPRGRFVQRLLDTPLPKIRMNGWLFYRWPFQGFLHWGYNYWYRSQTRELIDVFAEQDGLRWPGWAYGDTCLVYPGPDGPIDSLRWEVFGDSLQDYALLQAAGVPRDGKLLAPLASFEDFPRSEDWIRRARRAALRQAAAAK
ncbi:MAG: DUF4091 domain-containing protein [Candidatus Latescibacterota bacterium]